MRQDNTFLGSPGPAKSGHCDPSIIFAGLEKFLQSELCCQSFSVRVFAPPLVIIGDSAEENTDYFLV